MRSVSLGEKRTRGLRRSSVSERFITVIGQLNYHCPLPEALQLTAAVWTAHGVQSAVTGHHRSRLDLRLTTVNALKHYDGSSWRDEQQLVVYSRTIPQP